MPALAAGVLEGKTCAAPRLMLEDLRKQAPGTKWVEKRFVQDGKVWTSGALLNGLDMMRAFALHTWANTGAYGLFEGLLQIGHFPLRDVDYKDAPSQL